MVRYFQELKSLVEKVQVILRSFLLNCNVHTRTNNPNLVLFFIENYLY